MVGGTFLRATGSIRFDVKTERRLTKPWEFSTSFSRFVEGLPIQGTLKYTGHFLGQNRLKEENFAIFFDDLSVFWMNEEKKLLGISIFIDGGLSGHCFSLTK